MREDNTPVLCELRDGFQLPRPGGETATPGDRVLLPPGFAHRWAARGALAILDEDQQEGNDAA